MYRIFYSIRTTLLYETVGFNEKQVGIEIGCDDDGKAVGRIEGFPLGSLEGKMTAL